MKEKKAVQMKLKAFSYVLMGTAALGVVACQKTLTPLPGPTSFTLQGTFTENLKGSPFEKYLKSQDSLKASFAADTAFVLVNGSYRGVLDPYLGFFKQLEMTRDSFRLTIVHHNTSTGSVDDIQNLVYPQNVGLTPPPPMVTAYVKGDFSLRGDSVFLSGFYTDPTFLYNPHSNIGFYHLRFSFQIKSDTLYLQGNPDNPYQIKELLRK